MMYVPFAQAPFWGANVVVRSELSPSTIAAAIRRQVQTLDSGLPVTEVRVMSEVVDRSVAQPRFRALLLALFAGMALVLAGTGIFGVISYSVVCRTREIGIRVALGAQRGMILGMVLRETLVPLQWVGAVLVVGSVTLLLRSGSAEPVSRPSSAHPAGAASAGSPPQA